MRFQLWRRVGKRAPKNTCGVVDQVGFVTAELESEVAMTEPADEWFITTFHATDRTPMIPGDILISSRIEKRYKVISVELSTQLNDRYPWKVTTRTLQPFERFAKHRDYQQCSRKKSADHANPPA